MLGSLRRRLLIADPDLRRTYSAGRATVAVAAAIGMAIPLTRATEQSPIVVVLSVFLALRLSLPLSLPIRSQLRTEVAAWLIATCAVTLGAALGEHEIAAAAVFVLVMAGGAWASGFGPQGLSLGLVAFLSYFFTLFARANLAQLPWLLAAVTIGITSASVVRNVILPDRPARSLARLLIALRGHTRVFTRTSRGRGERDEERRAEVVRNASVRVDEIVLHLHDLLDAHVDLVPDEHQFHRDLFAVVTLTHLMVLQEEGAERSFQAALLAPASNPAERLEMYLDALAAATSAGTAQAIGRREGPLPGETALEKGSFAAGELKKTNGRFDWRGGSPRRALQVGIAGVISIAAGLALSPDLWYWAAMTAFFVFANAETRGATLRKAVERTLGTVGGVAAGLLLVSVLAGHPVAQLLAVFPLLFVGFWMLPASYAVTTVAITILLALLYAMMGLLTVDILLFRLGETALGAAIGGAVAYFVMPARTTSAVDKTLRRYFAALDDLLGVLPAVVASPREAEGGTLEAVRRLDRAAGAMVKTINPAITAVPGRRARNLRQKLVLALTARYWANRVAARAMFHPAPSDLNDLVVGAAAVRGRLATLRGAADPGMELPSLPDAPASPMAAALWRLDAVLVELARRR